MLGVVGHRDRLVDEQNRDAVLDAVRAAKPGVIEELVVDQQQRPAVLRANQDAEQLFVEHNGRLADTCEGAWILARARRRAPNVEPGLLVRVDRVLHLSL